MKKLSTLVVSLIVALLPVMASAHERQQFEINGITYQFVMGSIGEPVHIDDKSGVELRVERVNILAGHEDHHTSGPGAVEGLEKTLKVEVQSHNESRIMELTPGYAQPGMYRAVFYPTAAGTYTYRFFGTLEDIPVDLTFTCASGHVMEGAEDVTREEVGPGITRVLKAGSFGCPKEKSDMGFPYAFPSSADLRSSDYQALGLAAAAFSVTIFARIRTRK